METLNMVGDTPLAHALQVLSYVVAVATALLLAMPAPSDKTGPYYQTIYNFVHLLASFKPTPDNAANVQKMGDALGLLNQTIHAVRTGAPAPGIPVVGTEVNMRGSGAIGPGAIANTLGMLAAICVSAVALSACSPTQQAQVAANIQTANAVALQDARLFCAVATPAGPTIVAIASAAGAPVVATGTAKLVVDAACAAANGIPVAPPAIGTVVPTVAAPVAAGTPTAPVGIVPLIAPAS